MKTKKLMTPIVVILVLAMSTFVEAGLRDRYEAAMSNVRANYNTIISKANAASKAASDHTSKAVGAFGGIAGPIPGACGYIIGKELPEAVVGLSQTGRYYIQGFKQNQPKK